MMRTQHSDDAFDVVDEDDMMMKQTCDAMRIDTGTQHTGDV
jgi:hypothetical protein